MFISHAQTNQNPTIVNTDINTKFNNKYIIL